MSLRHERHSDNTPPTRGTSRHRSFDRAGGGRSHRSQEEALRAIEDDGRLDLSMRDSAVFVEALLNPQPVNDRMRDTVRRYRRQTGI